MAGDLTNSGEFITEVALAMGGSQQQAADAISNETRNGCFEFCDGWPSEKLESDARDIILGLACMVETDIDDKAKDRLLEKAREYGQRAGAVQSACREECPGAYSLFGEDEDLEDGEGNNVIKECPVKIRLAQVAFQVGQTSKPE